MSDKLPPTSQEIKINPKLAQRIQAKIGQNVYCFVCHDETKRE